MRDDLDVYKLLGEIEIEFRHQYWLIRNSRLTHWKAVNRTRVLAEFMYMMGVPRWAVKEARYCLKLRNCKRCAYDDFKCHAIVSRMRRGDFNDGK